MVASGRTTCCCCIPVQQGAIVISILGVLAGGVFGVVYAKNIASGVVFVPGQNAVETAIPYAAMGSWMLLALISFLGVFATWNARPKLAAIYFWSLLAHFIVDLGFLVAIFIVTIKGGRAALDQCVAEVQRGGFQNSEALCDTALDIFTVIFLVLLGLYKLIALYMIYVILQFKRWAARQALEAAANKAANAQQQAQWQQGPDAPRNWSKFED